MTQQPLKLCHASGEAGTPRITRTGDGLGAPGALLLRACPVFFAPMSAQPFFVIVIWSPNLDLPRLGHALEIASLTSRVAAAVDCHRAQVDCRRREPWREAIC
jgi:hypothetical protein